MHDELARGTEQLITESLNVYKLMFTLYGEFGLKIEMKFECRGPWFFIAFLLNK